MHTLIYTSAATRTMTPDDLQGLLKQARRKNQTLHITGLLVYYQGEFMQLLEGEKAAIFDLYETIFQDERHESIHLTYDAPIDQRGFQEWAMAFVNLGDIDPIHMAGYSDFLQSGFTSEIVTDHPSRAQRLLLSLRDQLLTGSSTPRG